MGKFLLGLITGAILVILICVLGFFALASLKSKPPTVADGSSSHPAALRRTTGEAADRIPHPAD